MLDTLIGSIQELEEAEKLVAVHSGSTTSTSLSCFQRWSQCLGCQALCGSSHIMENVLQALKSKAAT